MSLVGQFHHADQFCFAAWSLFHHAVGTSRRKFTDMGAYLVGSTLGRHKMIPRISPKKTWEAQSVGLPSPCGVFLCRWVMPNEMAALTNLHAVIIGLLAGRGGGHWPIWPNRLSNAKPVSRIPVRSSQDTGAASIDRQPAVHRTLAVCLHAPSVAWMI